MEKLQVSTISQTECWKKVLILLDLLWHLFLISPLCPELFQMIWRWQKLLLPSKEEIEMIWVIIGPFLSFLQLQESLKSLYMTNCMLIFSILIFWVIDSLALDHSILQHWLLVKWQTLGCWIWTVQNELCGSSWYTKSIWYCWSSDTFR